jgi:acid phosphatase (class A)
MNRAILVLCLTLCLAPLGARAQPVAAAALHKPLQVLSWDTADPLRLIPPPPARGSDAERAELAELHDIQAHRSPARLAQAQWDQDHQNWTLYVSTLGPAFDMNRLPATAKVLKAVQQDNTAVVGFAKSTFHRMRPWAADPTLKGCKVSPKDDPYSSYPSGHSDVGYALGVTLAYLLPDKAQAILARASDYAYSRLVCGVHFRSDTTAGQALATALTLEMLHSPKMLADLDAARVELRAAGL